MTRKLVTMLRPVMPTWPRGRTLAALLAYARVSLTAVLCRATVEPCPLVLLAVPDPCLTVETSPTRCHLDPLPLALFWLQGQALASPPPSTSSRLDVPYSEPPPLSHPVAMSTPQRRVRDVVSQLGRFVERLEGIFTCTHRAHTRA